MVDLLKTFLSREVETKIDEYVLKMKSKNFLSELNLDLNSKFISLKSYNLHDLEQLKSIWLEIANLSVNLYVEYEFFRQFSFPNRFESKIYEENLKKLGYQQYNGMWRIDKIPNRQCIIENIFYSYIYIFLCQEKKQELDNEKSMKENAENSLLNLRNTGTNNDTINEQFNPINIVPVVAPPIIEMGNIDNDLCEICGCELLKMNIENKPTENIDKWTCTKCSYNNEITVDLCVICLTPNLNKIVTMDNYELPEETWCCKTCRENNLFECYKCKKCRVPAEFFNKWRCGQCSFYNDKVAKHCGVCDIGNPYLVKCNLCMKGLVNKMYDKICKECTVLSERCTNKETFDYQDNRGTRLDTSTKRDQRRNKINQNIPRNIPENTKARHKDSIIDEKRKCKESGGLATYNKRQSETTELFYSLLQENKSSKQQIESKTILKSNGSRPCKNCKSKVCAINQYWCTKCEDSQWYCQNEACGGINFQNEYCKKCKAKNGSNFSNCINFEVKKDDGKEVQMWQCAFCLQFNAETLMKCQKCQNLRYLSCYKKCESCKWTNLHIMKKCNKCDAEI